MAPMEPIILLINDIMFAARLENLPAAAQAIHREIIDLSESEFAAFDVTKFPKIHRKE